MPASKARGGARPAKFTSLRAICRRAHHNLHSEIMAAAEPVRKIARPCLPVAAQFCPKANSSEQTNKADHAHGEGIGRPGPGRPPLQAAIISATFNFAILRTHIKNTGVSLAAMLLLCYCSLLAAHHEVADHDSPLLLRYRREVIYNSVSSSARATRAHPPTPKHITSNMSNNLRSKLAQSFSNATCDISSPPRASHLSRTLPRSQRSRRCSPAPKGRCGGVCFSGFSMPSTRI